MEELITVIIPIYNCEKYIKQAIESVKKQSFKKWEMIIIDDNSTDNSLEIVEKNILDVKEKVMIIKLKQNQGVAISRNLGIEKAKGKYIAFLDGDDIWEKEKLEKQVEFMNDNNYEFTYTGFKYLKDKKTKSVKAPKYFTYKKELKNTMILTSTVMLDVEKLGKDIIKMPNIKRGQDTATWWQILKKGYIAYGLNEQLTYYRQVENSLSHNKIKASKRTWDLYRKVEKFGILKSLYYFCFYAINAIRRRIGIKK